MQRSLALVTGILAILKAGAAYVPIDPAYPAARIAFILEDAGVAMTLTEAGLLPALPPGAAPAFCIEDNGWPSAARTANATRPRVDNLAYVIYTSGSTGRPKGVCIEHGNIVSYVRAIIERLRLEAGMRHALVSTVAADLGNTVLFPSLATGGCLHVLSQERAESPALLAEYFRREDIDVLKITPSHLAALQSGKERALILPRRRLILGGEPIGLARVEELRAMAPECEIHNHYGPTETTVGVLTYRVGSILPRTRSGSLPLGTPLSNSRVYILAEDGQPASASEQGEICIGGAGVARGYLDRPELTAERFVPDPFSAERGARLYRSGDLGRVLPDGAIEFCGRKDEQLKIAGHRVEPGEIAQALREEHGVREAVVVARDDGNGGKQLVAYVAAERAEQPLWAHPAVHLLPDGAPVAHLNRNETDYLYHEIFVRQAYLRHGITLRPGDCIIDAGANIGLFTVFASRMAPGARIIAVEPNPAAFACLEANARAWGSAVTCLPCGLSSEEKEGELTFFEGLSLLSGFHADAATERGVVETYVLNQQPGAAEDAQWNGQLRELIDGRMRASTVRAPLRPLSQVIAEHGLERIDLLKINVEKSELDVLRGLGPHDWTRVRQMVIEVDRQADLEPITALLVQHGFELAVEQDPLLARTELRYVYAVRPGDGRRLIASQAPDAHLVAVPAGEPVLSPARLRKRLNERLPRHMVPQAFVLLDRFPLLPNGKIDRLSLPAAPAAHASGDSARARTETEIALTALWSELLQVDAIGVDDDFFDLGGQSLLAIRMVARVREAFGVDVQLRNLFDRPTIAALAEMVDALAWRQKPDTPQPAGGQTREEFSL